MRFRRLGLLLGYLLCAAAWADDDDTRLLREQTQRAVEQVEQASNLAVPLSNTLHYEGQQYYVPDQLDSLEAAIYIAINSRQWHLLADFIARYRLQAGHRVALVAMAQGLLAHSQGDYPQALQDLSAASENEPQDSRIALELARLQFEDYQEQNASAGFAKSLTMDLPLPAQQLVQQYQAALEARSQWHGSAAIGWVYNTNINQGNGHYSCLYQLAGFCLFDRQMPEALPSTGLSYELSLQRRVNLFNNHNLLIRPMSYGNYFSQHNPSPSASIQNFSNNLAQLQLGYQYLNARDSVAVMPYFEHYYRNRHSEYLAYGVQLEWRHSLSPQWQLGSNLDAKRYQYTDIGRKFGTDYQQYQLGGNVSYSLQGNTSIYGAVDFTRKQYDEAQASNKEWSVRAGLYHAFADTGFVNAMAIYRRSRNDAFDGFLDARRSEQQQIYILRAGLNQLEVAGLSPELRLRHTINRSNLDWAFGFKQTEIGVFLRKDF